MDWYSFSSHGFFSVSFVFSFLIIFFFKIIFVDFIFLILSWLEFNFVIKLNHVGKQSTFSSQNTVDCYSVSSHDFVFVWFFQNCLCQIYFFNIELVENYNYKSLQIRLNHVGKHCSFHHKTLWIVTVFPTWFFSLFFFVIFFLKLFLSIFFFLILSWLII
jgi:hypothetical protein